MKSVSVFLFVGLLGIGLANLFYGHLQVSPTAASALENRSPVNLSDADKKLIDVRDSTSKWLLGLAVGLLPGLVLKKPRDANDEARLQEQMLPMAAAALLLVSMYGFFLAQDSVAFILSRGPQYHLYGNFGAFPILLQFWTLMAALILLMAHWLAARSKLAFPTLAVALVIFLVPQLSWSAEVSRPTAAKCAESWSKQRAIALSGEDLSAAANVVAAIARRADLPKIDVCEYTRASLDQLRFQSELRSTPNESVTISALLREANASLRAPGISSGEIVEQLIKISEVWRSASGLLHIEGKPSGARVLLDSKLVGVTDLDIRLKPGTYSLEILVDGGVAYKNRDVTIKDGAQWKITFGR